MITDKISSGYYNNAFSLLYSNTAIAQKRYISAAKKFNEYYKGEDAVLFSVPGRTEICGNHTDHQGGKIIAGSIDYDIIAFASKTGSNIIRIKSEGFDEITVNTDSLKADDKLFGTPQSLIAGIAKKLIEEKMTPDCGFDAYITSDVLKGSGLSSSAAFEILIAKILSFFYLDDSLDAVKLSLTSQYAENVFFGKPSGLMDQLACSVGGIIAVDFAQKKSINVEKLDFDLSSKGYHLFIIDSKADHADLTDEYSAITAEMKSVSMFFKKELLSEVDSDEFYKNITKLREKVSDRAVLRAIHYFNEIKRVEKLTDALKKGDIAQFFDISKESGRSSFMYLQNIYSSSDCSHQALAVVLALCEKELDGKGAFRVHGGGFAGTVQAFVPDSFAQEFKKSIESVIGKDTCHMMNIRKYGAVCLDKINEENSYA